MQKLLRRPVVLVDQRHPVLVANHRQVIGDEEPAIGQLQVIADVAGEPELRRATPVAAAARR